jgi:hypothetical protein
MSPRRFPWLDITGLCSGEDGKDILVDRGRAGRYAQQKDKTGFFSKVTTVLPLSDLLGPDLDAFAKSQEPSHHPAASRRPCKWQDVRINPN